MPAYPMAQNPCHPPLLALHHVTVMRGEFTALQDITLRVEAGEHVCILGPNGCGKSTLIKTITRECYPVANEGSSISIFGRERWNVFELRSLLGIVSPDLLASCTSDATGRDVVLSGFFSSTRIFPHHAPNPALLEKADAALAGLGIAHLAGRPVAQMSSGEAKRTLIARALVHEPQTLLFDEPGNALDIGAQIQLARACKGRPGHSPGHAPRFRNHSRDRASGTAARRSHRCRGSKEGDPYVQKAFRSIRRQHSDRAPRRLLFFVLNGIAS